MSGRCLQVKAILLKEGTDAGQREIRRFRVEGEGGGRLLQSVQTHVRSVFNVDNTGRQCSLYWKDEDGDLIQFSSDEELAYAVDNMTDDTLRIYVIVSGTGNEESGGSYQEGTSTRSDGPFQFQAPPPPPTPPHPHGCPPPFPPGPWAHGSWKKWKPMGAGGWKGGWKGGLYFGCPWNLGHEGFKCGRKGKGMLKKQWEKGMKKMMKMKGYKATVANQQKEFQEVRTQVPAPFRRWVRKYVHTWYTQNPQAAQTALAEEKLPENVGQDFPQWLNSFLQHHHPHPSTWGEGAEEGKDTRGMGETGSAPDCLPPVYFRWLCLFMPRFFSNNAHIGGFSFSAFGDGSTQYPEAHYYSYSHGFCPKKGYGKFGKHGYKGKKGGKHGSCSSSSESEDSDSGLKVGDRIPKGLRKYARLTLKHVRKGKSGNPKVKAKATRAGLTPEVQECVEQIILEWQAKLSGQPHHVIAKEMLAGERTLPAGFPRQHFVWLINFLGRRQDRKAGKCGFMSGWLSADSTSDNTSGDEAMPEGQGCGPCPAFPPGMGPMHGHPFTATRMGAPPHPFPMPPGMDHPYGPPPPPPPPPPMYSFYPPPPPPFWPGMSEYADESSTNNGKAKGCKDPSSDEDMTSSSDDMVEDVTEGVKKL